MGVPAGIDAQWLKDGFLYGVDLTRDDGEPFPDLVFELPLEAACEMLESEIGFRLTPGTYTERFDVTPNSTWEFFQVDLSRRPVRAVKALRLRFGNQPGHALPIEWAMLRSPNTGQLDILPAGAVSGTFFGAIASYIPSLSMYNRTPGYLEVEYDYGFDDSDPEFKTPASVKQIVGWAASLLALDTAGDLIAGAGIASMSIGLNGLSQSVGTTSSATNAGYGARIKSYQDQLKTAITSLRARYRGLIMNVI